MVEVRIPASLYVRINWADIIFTEVGPGTVSRANGAGTSKRGTEVRMQVEIIIQDSRHVANPLTAKLSQHAERSSIDTY